MIAEQPAAQHGSQRWLQISVNRCPDIINTAIANELGLFPNEEIKWLSPLECDGFAEYRDEQILERLGVGIDKRLLNDFRPYSPQWDGLAQTSSGRLLLVEAKANIPEFDTNPLQVTPRDPLEKIKAALAEKAVLGETKEFLEVKSSTDWSQCFYQYTNRLAHLYLFKELNRLNAILVFVYFVNDRTVRNRDPVSREGWETAIALVTTHLGIPHSRWISENVKDVFIDVSTMNHVSWP